MYLFDKNSNKQEIRERNFFLFDDEHVAFVTCSVWFRETTRADLRFVSAWTIIYMYIYWSMLLICFFLIAHLLYIDEEPVVL